jgi:hypothetical protein
VDKKSIAIHQIMEFPFHRSSPQTNRRDILVVTDGYKWLLLVTRLCKKTPVHWNCVKSRSAFYIKETSRGGWFLCTIADVAIFPKVVGRDQKNAKKRAKVGDRSRTNN